jgi:hypothetical protein
MSGNAVRGGVSKTGSAVSVELAAREQAVARADAAFATSLEDASEAGRETVYRVVFAALPLLVGVGMLAGAVLVVQAFRSPRASRVPRQRSLASELARTAVIALASAAGRRVATWWARRHS